MIPWLFAIEQIRLQAKLDSKLEYTVLGKICNTMSNR